VTLLLEPDLVIPPALAPASIWRVLLTGSREWGDRKALWDVLTSIAAQCYGGGYVELVIVHGDCPDGADAIAKAWVSWATSRPWRRLSIRQEPYPADWPAPCRPACKDGCRRLNRKGQWYCNAAGSYRNALMISLGADLCVAFFAIGARNSGTSGCAKGAGKAGIPVRRYRGKAKGSLSVA
jgi:hypothetical protein